MMFILTPSYVLIISKVKLERIVHVGEIALQEKIKTTRRSKFLRDEMRPRPLVFSKHKNLVFLVLAMALLVT